LRFCGDCLRYYRQAVKAVQIAAEAEQAVASTSTYAFAHDVA